MSIEALASISGIDTKQGLTNCMDDEDLYMSIIGMYMEQLVENLPQLAQAYSEQNWIEIGKLAHSIKGASASIGAFEIQAISAVIEKAAKHDEVSIITDNFESFISLLNTTSSALKQSL
ncbi:Hpt domain-containing protein [uncultured Psychrosphaera sp.]|jgi:HPt (histidine-containing phosphotransfer) domain-containing protein|uniref:Hpt domain-containing protein n=1 Tax=uncultured Psychrosphaera sp. TaxID=1403522 RepID=UPI002619D4EF|nr:Hpt domain-containing protein [uncultured Psychrosphaera sp.]